MEENNQKPLTLNELAKYNQDVLFPFMQENFATKKDLNSFKDEMNEFKNEMYNFRDKAVEDLSKLTQEKTVGDAQDKRKQKVLEIHNDALKRNKILSPEEVLQIDSMGAL